MKNTRNIVEPVKLVACLPGYEESYHLSDIKTRLSKRFCLKSKSELEMEQKNKIISKFSILKRKKH